MLAVFIGHSVWSQAEDYLRGCGRIHRECIVYLCGEPWSGVSRRVTEVYHPKHRGSAVAYEVPVAELSALNSWLSARRLSVLVQVHTHPGAAFHSPTDDAWPTIEAAGLLSLVVPDFCRSGLWGLPGCYLAKYLGAGQWRELPRDEMEKTLVLEP
jgi:hypothetical protein